MSDEGRGQFLTGLSDAGSEPVLMTAINARLRHAGPNETRSTCRAMAKMIPKTKLAISSKTANPRQASLLTNVSWEAQEPPIAIANIRQQSFIAPP